MGGLLPLREREGAVAQQRAGEWAASRVALGHLAHQACGRAPPSPTRGEGIAMWTATVFTIFPEMFPGPLGHSLAGKALHEGLWRLETVDIRDFARDKHRSVDDAPFGGGPGMVMRPDIVDAAIAATPLPAPLLMLSPRGRPIDQARVRALAE